MIPSWRGSVFPYLREAELAGSNLFAYEAHRPEGDFRGGVGLAPQAGRGLRPFEEIPDLDLFVVDEFYKLALDEDDPDRTRLLNQAFHRPLTTGAQFYLLGPNVGGIGKDTLDKLDNCVWIDSWDTTVAVDVIATKKSHAKYRRLRQIAGECEQRGEKTLIYCYRPSTAEKVAIELLEAGIGTPGTGAADAAEWLGSKVHPRRRVARALASGIGVHHGQLPRAFGHYLVNAFDSGEVNFLICTSTMIEGVNTKAKNVIVYDHLHGRQSPLDLFTYNNIRGRSGRMHSHVSGRVYLFKDEPDAPLHEIDIPILAEPEDAPADLPRHARGVDGGLHPRAGGGIAPRVPGAGCCPRSDPCRQCRGSAQGCERDPGPSPRAGGGSLVEGLLSEERADPRRLRSRLPTLAIFRCIRLSRTLYATVTLYLCSMGPGRRRQACDLSATSIAAEISSGCSTCG